MYFSLLFLFGLGIGSFLNVLIIRYDERRSLFHIQNLRGRSHCPHCKARLRWYELIPLVSFIIQRGRCRTCKSSISPQYPIIELLTAALFVAVPYRLVAFYGLTFPGAALTPAYLIIALWLAVFILLLVLSTIDIRKHIIPNEIPLLLAALGLGIVAVEAYMVAVPSGAFFQIYPSFIRQYAALFGLHEHIILGSFFAAALGVAFFGAIVAATKGRGMGMGDVKLAGALGLVFGWPDAAIALLLSFVIGALVFSPLLIFKKTTAKKQIPFGPFMALAAIMVFFFGEYILSWYFRLFILL